MPINWYYFNSANWTVTISHMIVLSLRSFIKPHIDSVKVSAHTHCIHD